MARRQQRNVARAAIELSPVVHEDPEDSGHVVLEVRGFAALGVDERLDRCRPFPARVEHRAADRRAADLDELEPALRELADLVRFLEVLAFGLFHRLPPVRLDRRPHAGDVAPFVRRERRSGNA
jgi:hypothetical protein